VRTGSGRVGVPRRVQGAQGFLGPARFQVGDGHGAQGVGRHLDAGAAQGLVLGDELRVLAARGQGLQAVQAQPQDVLAGHGAQGGPAGDQLRVPGQRPVGDPVAFRLAPAGGFGHAGPLRQAVALQAPPCRRVYPLWMPPGQVQRGLRHAHGGQGHGFADREFGPLGKPGHAAPVEVQGVVPLAFLAIRPGAGSQDVRGPAVHGHGQALAGLGGLAGMPGPSGDTDVVQGVSPGPGATRVQSPQQREGGAVAALAGLPDGGFVGRHVGGPGAAGTGDQHGDEQGDAQGPCRGHGGYPARMRPTRIRGVRMVSSLSMRRHSRLLRHDRNRTAAVACASCTRPGRPQGLVRPAGKPHVSLA